MILTVLEVAPVFLKKEKRIEAMLFLYFVALMIVSLIEREMRMNMAKEKIEKLPILPQGMNSKKPTWNNIRYFFRNVHYKDGTSAKTFDALDWLAQLVTHIPSKGEQMVRYYGFYSNKSSCLREKAGTDDQVPALIDSDISRQAF